MFYWAPKIILLRTIGRFGLPTACLQPGVFFVAFLRDWVSHFRADGLLQEVLVYGRFLRVSFSSQPISKTFMFRLFEVPVSEIRFSKFPSLYRASRFSTRARSQVLHIQV
jgi:hypothetical protein